MANYSPITFYFPIIVSHGCDHKDTRNVLNSYSENIIIWEFSFEAPSKPKTMTAQERAYQGYRSLAHHYNSSLNRIFTGQTFSAVIIVEDDLEVATDFFEYFAATYHLLVKDVSLFCVSAWNDNGRPPLVDESRNNLIYRGVVSYPMHQHSTTGFALLGGSSGRTSCCYGSPTTFARLGYICWGSRSACYQFPNGRIKRSDFFPGLGWMMLRSFWMQIRDEWPDIYWDEYVRKPKVRNGRACLRPEIGRTITFGAKGVSQGQYFKQYLGSMVLNRMPYPFPQSNLSYLIKSDYDLAWFKAVYIDSKELSLNALQTNLIDTTSFTQSFRVTYSTQKSFVKIATALKMMPDAKSGVVRNAYRGAVSVRWNNRWLYIAPPSSWSGYDVKWQ